jgi:hypothetical protein
MSSKTGVAKWIDDLYFRIGVGILGALAGGFIGLVVLWPLIYLEVVNAPLGRLLLTAAAAGAWTGILTPNWLMVMLEGIIWFVWGMLGGMHEQGDLPSDTPRWLQVAFVFGVGYLIMAMILLG